MNIPSDMIQDVSEIKLYRQIPYSLARANIIATLTRRDGYNGHTAKIGVAYVLGYAIAVYQSGTFRLSTEKYDNLSDMLGDLIYRTKTFNSSIISVDETIDHEFVSSLPV